MIVLVVDAHPIFRRGVLSALQAGLRAEDELHDASSVGGARSHPAVTRADVILVEQRLPEFCAFVTERAAAGSRVVVHSATCEPEEVREALRCGAAGVLATSTMTPEGLIAALHAAVEGTSVLAPEVVAALAAPVTERAPASARPVLTTRERQVLRLLAGGHATREVAQELSYSERTVKNVLHDAVTKLDARSRSQAIASAVRDGLI